MCSEEFDEELMKNLERQADTISALKKIIRAFDQEDVLEAEEVPLEVETGALKRQTNKS